MQKNEYIEEIFAFLDSIRPLPEKCKNYLSNVVRYKKVAKKEVLLKIGDINHDLYFIRKGFLKCFHYHEKKEVYDWFFFETDTVVSTGSFYKGVPSVQCIQAGEDVEVFYISKQDYEYLKWHFGEFAYIACALLEKYLVIFSEHAMLIRDQKPFEKYQQTVDNMPQLLLRVDGKDLATWMDMHPSTLSRKKDALRKKSKTAPVGGAR